METTEWFVSEEHDEQAFKRLGRALRTLGAIIPERSWGLAGSQELSEWNVALPEGQVTVTAETYAGLTVAGSPPAVRQVRQAYESVAAR